MLSAQRSAMPGDGWRKSTHSSQDGDCVEAGQGAGLVLVRDSRDRGGPVVAVTPGAWRVFTGAVKRA